MSDDNEIDVEAVDTKFVHQDARLEITGEVHHLLSFMGVLNVGTVAMYGEGDTEQAMAEVTGNIIDAMERQGFDSDTLLDEIEGRYVELDTTDLEAMDVALETGADVADS